MFSLTKGLTKRQAAILLGVILLVVVAGYFAWQQKSGADFAIVTDPTNPDKPVDLNKVAKLPEGTTVNLNQYNVHAYKKRLLELLKETVAAG